MQFVTLDTVTLHYRYRPGKGLPVVFLNSLGTDLRIWDEVIAALPADAPILCLDKRGHGLSDDGPVTMDLLAGDVAALMDHLGIGPALICGVSVGGMIAQTLTVARPDLVAALVLCCTGAKIGDAEMWTTRIDAVRRDGIGALSDAILERWFSHGFRTAHPAVLAGYRNMLVRMSAEGYAKVCAAIRDSDLTRQTKGIKVPTHCISGTQDLSTPPDLVKALAALIPGASFSLFDGCGHLPCIETPEAVARVVEDMRS